MLSKNIGLAEFIDIVGTDELDGFEIDEQGIWPERHDKYDLRLLAPSERAVLHRTPEWHQPGEPLLAFRCDLSELRKLLDWYGLADLIAGDGQENDIELTKTDNRKKWEIPERIEYKARSIAQEIIAKMENNGERIPGIEKIAQLVEKEMKDQNLVGPRGDYLSCQTIKREALTGITGRKANGKK